MHIHRSRFPDKILTPDLAEKAVSRKNRAGMLHKELQHLEFLIGESDLFAVRGNGALIRIQAHVPCVKHGVGTRLLTSAQHRPHPRHHLHHSERLYEIVIRTEIEALYFIVLHAARGRHYHRDITPRGVRVQLFEHGDAVLSGQHHVKNDKIGHILPKRVKKSLAVGKPAGFKAR